jgi:L-2,4-diaminobutyrate decarboxylase
MQLHWYMDKSINGVAAMKDESRNVSKELSGSFQQYFLNNTAESVQAYQVMVNTTAAAIAAQLRVQTRPYNGQSPAALRAAVNALDLFPAKGISLETILQQTSKLVLESNIAVFHPHCAAHLHCPVFIASLAAEMIITAFNQSMDSWDQSPAATIIEQALCDKICRWYGFDENADAVFTGGATMSNFMGLLLARDHFCKQYFNWDVQQKGLPPEARRFRILCGQNAHFTVAQSASILGLGQEAVVTIADNGFEEDPLLLQCSIAALKQQGLLPIAYVTTAGTTDFGSIGNITQLAAVAHKHGMWLHVDAAYGGALMFSNKHKHRLNGIEKADSVTIDFHKLFYQPVSCGVFIVKNKKSFEYIRLHAAYLNPESNEALGITDLVYKSIQTTRRFDALKPFIALQHIGLENFGKMLEHTIDLAAALSKIIEADEQLELAYQTPLNAVVFRWLPEKAISPQMVDSINSSIKTRLLLSGKAVIGQTVVYNKAFLKFTLLNPLATVADMEMLLDEIKKQGRLLEEVLTVKNSEAVNET